MKKSTTAKLAAFLTAMLWGSTFAIGKIAAESFSASFIIALRFTVASVVLLVAAYPLRKLLNKEYWTAGIWMGVTIFVSYFLQTIGLTMETSPGKSAFLSTTYCVMVPFFYWFATKERPKILHIICVFVCLAGIGIVSLQGGLGMATGDVLTVLSGVPYAINMVINALVAKDKNTLLLTTIELWVVSILAWIFVMATGTFPETFPLNAVGGIVYLGVFATALCLFLQAYCLKYADAAICGMILSLESVFGVVFAIILYHEQVTLRMLIGFAVIFAAIMLSQKEDEAKKEE